jgi:ABC-type molybdate transport system substrate-binding protein
MKIKWASHKEKEAGAWDHCLPLKIKNKIHREKETRFARKQSALIYPTSSLVQLEQSWRYQRSKANHLSLGFRLR